MENNGGMNVMGMSYWSNWNTSLESSGNDGSGPWGGKKKERIDGAVSLDALWYHIENNGGLNVLQLSCRDIYRDTRYIITNPKIFQLQKLILKRWVILHILDFLDTSMHQCQPTNVQKNS